MSGWLELLLDVASAGESTPRGPGPIKRLLWGRRCPVCRGRLRRQPESAEGKPLKCKRCERVWWAVNRHWLRWSVAPEDRALFEQLAGDNSVKVIGDPSVPANLAASNAYKQELYTSFLEKSPGVVKLFRSKHVGKPQRHTMTYFIVDHGKAKVVEAHFGDPFGSDELQCIFVHTPDELEPGYLEREGKYVPLPNGTIPEGKELAIGYVPPQGKKTVWF